MKRRGSAISQITDIRRALVATLADLDVQTVAVAPAPAEFGDHAMAVDRVGFHVTVTTGPITPGSEDRLDDLMDPVGGVRALLEGDRTLGGLVGSLAVTKCSGYQALQTAPDAPPQLGATWTVQCLV